MKTTTINVNHAFRVVPEGRYMENISVDLRPNKINRNVLNPFVNGKPLGKESILLFKGIFSENFVPHDNLLFILLEDFSLGYGIEVNDGVTFIHHTRILQNNQRKQSQEYLLVNIDPKQKFLKFKGVYSEEISMDLS